MFCHPDIFPITAVLLSLALFAAANMVHGKTPRTPDTRFVEASESLIRANPAASRRA